MAQRHPAPAQHPPAATETMTAVVRDRYGDPQRVLRVEQVARPEPGEGEVLLRVHAAGLDQGVWHLVTGLPYPVRLAGYGIRAPRARGVGGDVAGRVEALGPGVAGLRVGQEVVGIATGAFAEYACARADKVVPAPRRLTPEQAAALPVSGLAALQAVRDHGRVRAGQRVLVMGASGGVGSFAVQIAVAAGAEVTGVASTAKLDLVRALGAHHVVDHTRQDVTAGPQRYDVILDTGGNRPLHRLRRVLTPRGRLVIVGSETGGRWLGGTDRQLRAMAHSPFLRQRLGSFISSENAADLGTLTAMVDAGTLTPAVDRTFPLAQVREAMRHLREGRARGKLVLLP